MDQGKSAAEAIATSTAESREVHLQWTAALDADLRDAGASTSRDEDNGITKFQLSGAVVYLHD